jgi:NADH:ubiquinone oxidoreductase subunit 6 (subunit J)
MNNRFKIFGLIALLGFVAGVIAQVTATYLIPWLIIVLPSLAALTSFMVAGFAGAILTVAIVGAWAYMTGKKDPY